ncbi:hypothetical protein GIB67_012003 [Kingdonia uniflora]|uniref:Uncharacterized protein n=1 Tax=Kingdonia uniflora TaxID=39325 RepID=A0A7J7M0B8_9MAGN|nr:hypothetical protein GIB67_012003 [Kingdonia uniflora]
MARSQKSHLAVEGRLSIKIVKVRERLFGWFGYDAELRGRECELEVQIEGVGSMLIISLRCVGEGIGRSGKDMEIGRKNMSKNEGSCNDGKVVLLKRERQKIRGFDKELSESDKRLKRAKDYGSRRWQYNNVVRGRLDPTADSHSDTEGVKFTVERKESILDKVAEEKAELDLKLEGLGLSRKKRVDSKSNKVRKAQSTRSMAGVDEGKNQVSCEEVQVNLSKTPGSSSSAQPNLKTCKIAQKYQKKWMLNSLLASSATESGEVTKEKRRRVESSWEKVAKVRPAALVDLRVVEERARLAALYGEEDTSKMVARLVKEIWLGIEEEKSELKKANNELEKELAQAKIEAMKEVKELKASHTEVDAIKADTYVEEGDDEEAEVVGVVDGLDGVSRQTVLDNHGDDVELPEGGSEKIGCDDLNERVAQLKTELAQATAHAKKVEAKERSGGSRIEGNVQKGNTNLRECQHKLDAALIREKVLEREIKAKESLVKRKEELLKDLPAREELNTEIGRHHARVVDLEAINLAESAKYIAKLEEDIIYHDKVDAEVIEWKNDYDRLKSCFKRLKARFATMVVPDASQSDLLRVIVAYFIEEVKRLE